MHKISAEEFNELWESNGLAELGWCHNFISNLYSFKDGSRCLFPYTGRFGVLFNNQEELDAADVNYFLSLVDLPKNYFQQESLKVEELKSGSENLISKMEQSLGLSYVSFDLKDETFELELEKKVKKYGRKRLFNDLSFEIGVFIGELYRFNVNGRWVFISNITHFIIKYDVPYIKHLNEKFTFCPWDVLEDIKVYSRKHTFMGAVKIVFRALDRLAEVST